MTGLFSNWLGDRVTSSPPITGGRFFSFLNFSFLSFLIFPTWQHSLQLDQMQSPLPKLFVRLSFVVSLLIESSVHMLQSGRLTAQNKCHCQTWIDHLLTCTEASLEKVCISYFVNIKTGLCLNQLVHIYIHTYVRTQIRTQKHAHVEHSTARTLIYLHRLINGTIDRLPTKTNSVNSVNSETQCQAAISVSSSNFPWLVPN